MSTETTTVTGLAFRVYIIALQSLKIILLCLIENDCIVTLSYRHEDDLDL